MGFLSGFSKVGFVENYGLSHIKNKVEPTGKKVDFWKKSYYLARELRETKNLTKKFQNFKTFYNL